MEKNKKVFKMGFTFILILIFIYLIVGLNIFSKGSILDIILFGKEKTRFGIFFILCIAFLIVFFVPLSWLSPLGAFFFGLKSFIYVVAGGLIAAIASFLIARIYKNEITKLVNRIYYRKKRKVDLDKVAFLIEEHGLSYIFFIRSMPFVPFSVANYISGITSVSLKDYILGTALGMTPGQVINSYFFVKAINITNNPLEVLAAILIKGGYVLLIILWQRKSKFNSKE